LHRRQVTAESGIDDGRQDEPRDEGDTPCNLAAAKGKEIAEDAADAGDAAL